MVAVTVNELFKIHAERFKLSLHHETKDQPIYALVVGKNGVKMKETPEAPATDSGPSGDGPPPAPKLPDGPVRFTMGANGAPKLPPGMAGKAMVMMNGTGGKMTMTASGQTTAQLVDMLANQLGKPVVDNTGLTKKYDYSLEFTPEEGARGGMMGMQMHAAGDGNAQAPPAESGPSLFTAVQEQLGLKLEQKKGPVDTLVIDRIEKTPTEN